MEISPDGIFGSIHKEKFAGNDSCVNRDLKEKIRESHSSLKNKNNEIKLKKNFKKDRRTSKIDDIKTTEKFIRLKQVRN